MSHCSQGGGLLPSLEGEEPFIHNVATSVALMLAALPIAAYPGRAHPVAHRATFSCGLHEFIEIEVTMYRVAPQCLQLNFVRDAAKYGGRRTSSNELQTSFQSFITLKSSVFRWCPTA
ncbi:unnamed protein product [Polarella glacialis]|uniref:Uncharacterized protein n=1 Tax=Polarella glacialis TaxID=89957 RepID=A0A813KNR8_POLGL|nr:unnamed protein product [Polarella glacialis]CAE8707937.1 unnamed protein product [Polarella glacialis]